MKKLDSNELKNIKGGINITAALIASLSRGINSILDLGRSLGTSIRRLQFGNFCSF